MAHGKLKIGDIIAVRAAPIVGGTCCDCGMYDPNAAPLGLNTDELYCGDCVDGAYHLTLELHVELIAAARAGREGDAQ